MLVLSDEVFEDLITDLRRKARVCARLADQALVDNHPDEAARLHGKADGICIAVGDMERLLNRVEG